MHLRKEKLKRFKEEVLTKGIQDKVLQQITKYGQPERDNSESLGKELRVRLELVFDVAKLGPYA